MSEAAPITLTNRLQLSEAEAAREFAKIYGGQFKYDFTNRRWLHFCNGRWARCALGEHERAAKELARRYAHAAADVVADPLYHEAERFARRLASSNGVTGLLKAAQSEEEIAARAEQFDTAPRLFNATNGTLELGPDVTAPFSFRPAQPGDMLTFQAGVAYDPNAGCPTFDQFLLTTFDGNEELIGYVQRLLGSCLVGGNNDQVFPICWGEGANGKSTLLNLIRHIFSDYGQTLSGDALLQKRAGSATNDLADLRGVRFAVVTELPPNAAIDTALVKRLTGSDYVRARRLYGNNEEFTPQVTVIAAANSKPKLPAGDEAVWRRVHLIPFKHVVPPEDRDLELPDKLKAEGSGVLNWLIKGYADYLAQGLSAPPAVQAATHAYRDELDLVKRFVDESCDIGSGLSESGQNLRSAFESWCAEGGEMAVSPSAFSQRLATLGFDKKRRGGGVVYFGLSIKPIDASGSLKAAA